jgi:trk system potassium uptake protein TrkH
MRWRYILKVVGILTIFFGLTMVFPLLWELYYQDQSISPLLKSMALTLGAGVLLQLIFRSAKAEHIRQREGMAIVAVGWTAIGLFGALPFYLGIDACGFVDAFFESVSGVTTTGNYFY